MNPLPDALPMTTKGPSPKLTLPQQELLSTFMPGEKIRLNPDTDCVRRYGDTIACRSDTLRALITKRIIAGEWENGEKLFYLTSLGESLHAHYIGNDIPTSTPRRVPND